MLVGNGGSGCGYLGGEGGSCSSGVGVVAVGMEARQKRKWVKIHLSRLIKVPEGRRESLPSHKVVWEVPHRSEELASAS